MKSRIMAFIVSVAMLVALCSCAESKGNNVSESDSNQSNTASDTISSEENDDSVSSTEAKWNPKVSQRDLLKKKNCLCGVHYVGYSEADMFDMNSNRKYYDNLFAEAGLIQEYPFLKKIPDEQFVSTPLGHDLYIIIPSDPAAHVEVNLMKFDETNGFELKVEDTLYVSDIGAPFVLQCNYSDIFSDAEIFITDSSGQELRWSPFLSLRDGRLDTSSDDGKLVYDFTEYSFSDDEYAD